MTLFRLTEHLGFWPHPDYLLDWLSAEQLMGWDAYMTKVGRFGVDRDDIHFALVAAGIAAWGGSKSGPRAFMPYYDPLEQDDDGFEERMGGLIEGLGEKSDG